MDEELFPISSLQPTILFYFSSRDIGTWTDHIGYSYGQIMLLSLEQM